MESQGVPYNPHNDIWRFQGDMARIQQIQAEHGDRLTRLERRHDDDARMKSVWGASSPFIPSGLGGTPQQVPLHHPPNEPFSTFDDDQNNLLGSLHLDSPDEPRRIGATSRANSVRFDESANQGWAHTSRSSIDLIPRTGSAGLGGHAMSERTYSHKSDGRQSSAGHSVHSATSGRANSLGLDTTYTNPAHASPLDTPGLTPGLFILGPVPAIIRCWLNTDFKHKSLLYAAMCTGSYTSHLDQRLVQQLGYADDVQLNENGSRTLKLSVYLPEAMQHPSSSSRPPSPTPQIPSFSVNFQVSEGSASAENKAIQIILGSDVLRARNADLLFSSNKVTMFDDERCKLSIPMVRPEDEASFKSLHTGTGELKQTTPVPRPHEAPAESTTGVGSKDFSEKSPSTLAFERTLTGDSSDDSHLSMNTPISSRQSLDRSAPLPGLKSNRAELKDSSESTPSTTSASRPSPAIWSNWRRENDKTPAASQSMDWAGASKGSVSNYQRRDTGIKVLKPLSRTVSGAVGQSSSPATGQSRFFDDGKRRTSMASTTDSSETQPKRLVSMESKLSSTSAGPKDANAGTAAKPRAGNPIGGASAFAWLNSDGSAK